VLNVIVTDPPRADLAAVDQLAGYGVATVHEAIGRNGYLGPDIRPNQQGARIAGTALTVTWSWALACVTPRSCATWVSPPGPRTYPRKGP